MARIKWFFLIFGVDSRQKMLNFCRYGRLIRIFSLAMALHVFNLSMDTRDPNPDFVPEDLSFNDIESVTEFFAEVVFNFNNAFAEHDEPDTNDGGTLDFYKFYCANPSSDFRHRTLFLQERQKFLVKDDDRLLTLSLDITSPPPKL